MAADDAESPDEHLGRWELRDQSWTLVSPTGIAISLSANERLVVQTLLNVTGRAVGRSELNQRLEADRSEEHTSELQSLMRISYAVFCLKKNTANQTNKTDIA